MISRLENYRYSRNTIDNFGIEYIGRDDKKAYVSFGYEEHAFKIYNRPERTWDDHLGNTPCGDYINLRLPNGRRIRAYLY